MALKTIPAFFEWDVNKIFELPAVAQGQCSDLTFTFVNPTSENELIDIVTIVQTCLPGTSKHGIAIVHVTSDENKTPKDAAIALRSHLFGVMNQGFEPVKMDLIIEKNMETAFIDWTHIKDTSLDGIEERILFCVH